ncbi:hypothetical protein [Methanosphaera sp.]|uniref:hypothetical protein n=1 Tax=Methanosphaera sp. TaxID=2666342 RepID=UPI002A777446|nr:hypothetical protein [Methanosphaera sp.]
MVLSGGIVLLIVYLFFKDIYNEGKIRAICVCNFLKDRFYDLSVHKNIVPMVLQIEVNPFN